MEPRVPPGQLWAPAGRPKRKGNTRGQIGGEFGVTLEVPLGVVFAPLGPHSAPQGPPRAKNLGFFGALLAGPFFDRFVVGFGTPWTIKNSSFTLEGLQFSCFHQSQIL